MKGRLQKITINYTNSGKRPASSSIFYGVQEFTTLPPEPISTINTHPSVAFILPGAQFTSKSDFEVPDGMFARLKREKKTFFVLAEIVYTDVGTNTVHITHFCAYYAPDDKNLKFPLCTRYNEAK